MATIVLTSGGIYSSNTVTHNISVQAGDVIVVEGGSSGGTTISGVADGGNSYAPALQNTANSRRVDKWVAVAAATNASLSVVVTFTGASGIFAALAVVRGANTTTPVRGVASTGYTFATGAGPYASGNVSGVAVGDVIFGLALDTFGNGFTIDAAFTAFSSGGGYFPGYKVATAAGAQGVTYTTGVGGETGIVGVLVIANAGGGAAATRRNNHTSLRGMLRGMTRGRA